MATHDTATGQALLEREEAALAAKKAALKKATGALDALRSAEQDAADAFEALRALGFVPRDLKAAFSLTSAEAARLMPRKSRGSGAAVADGGDTASAQVDGSVEEPREGNEGPAA